MNIISYFNYCILSAPLKQTIIQKIKWEIGKLINFKNHGVYKSFGSSKVIRPEIILQFEGKTKKIARSIIRKIKSKKDILNIKVENILIGDLLYDTFLKSNQIATINYSDEKVF